MPGLLNILSYTLPVGFEPTTFGLEVQRAIRCAKGAIAVVGFDPTTFGLWAQRASSAPYCFIKNI